MSKVLVSFLGGVSTNYRTAQYKMADGQVIQSYHAGLALQQVVKPDILIVCGTSSSAWPIFSQEMKLREDDIEAELDLQEQAEHNTVTQTMLDDLSPLIQHKLNLQHCYLQLMPFGKDQQEQISLLRSIAQYITQGDEVHLDITHGFRHLPMLMYVNALYLEQVKKAKVQGIYYGAFEMRLKETPMINLSGLLHLNQWLDAIQSFDKDGDYSVFAELLETEGMPVDQTNLLRQGALYERSANISAAHQRVQQITTYLENHQNSPGELFFPSLKERFDLIRPSSLYQRQRNLAWYYLNKNDFQRAVLFAFEAFISKLTKQINNRESNDFDERRHAQEDYQNQADFDATERRNYHLLRNLRNSMAHGTLPKEGSEEQKLLKNINNLKPRLNEIFTSLLPEMI